MWAKRETVLVKYDCDNLAEQRQILVTKPVRVKEGEIRGKYLYCYLEHFISVMRENKHELFTIVTMDLGSDNCQYCKHRMPIRDITAFHRHIYCKFDSRILSWCFPRSREAQSHFSNLFLCLVISCVIFTNLSFAKTLLKFS